MKDAHSRARRNERVGDVARADNAIIGLARYPQAIEGKARDQLAGPRRVSDQDDAAASLAETSERVARRTSGCNAIVDHSPDVAEHQVILTGKRREMIDEWGRRRRHEGN